MRARLAALRSVVGFVLMALWLTVTDVCQRIVFWPLVKLMPRHRERIMWPLMWAVARGLLEAARVGGAHLRWSGRIPTPRPLLVLMNHQSLLDIPVAYMVTGPPVPIIVTRRKYGRGAPLVSLMLRIMDYPLVDPYGDPRGAVAAVKKAAGRQEHGIVLFPEGHRSRTGELQPFETAGIRVILRRGRMPVYLIVTDGYWVTPKFKDFVFGIHRIRGETEVLGPYDPPEDAAELPAFIERMRGIMLGHLEGMRQRARS